MNISQLYVFSKNTDATASLRGYNYQTLRTLENWLDNFFQNKKMMLFFVTTKKIFSTKTKY